MLANLGLIRRILRDETKLRKIEAITFSIIPNICVLAPLKNCYAKYLSWWLHTLQSHCLYFPPLKN